ncbi:MAG: site-specific integrase [Cyanobacteria bacterium K_DeepCast_35m_m2_155]|nr:site-specific integrase [Cyanobacteria bacterium K_DeepCast_35m_m2_155]
MPAAVSTTDALSRQLVQSNAMLAAAGIRLRLERRGRTLNLRGPLPRRDAPDELRVQRLSLGLAADADGLKEAHRRLLQVHGQLEQQRFNWQDWSERPSSSNSSALGLEQQLSSFEAAFFSDPRRQRQPAGSRTTWSSAYLPYLRRLQRLAAGRQGGLDVPLLLAVLDSYELASRSRQQCTTALGALARHCGLTLPDDWSERGSGYGLHRAQFRQLPSDSEILALLELIPNRHWRLVFGLMATYGLRNHEAFFCDLSSLAPGGDRVIRVLPTSKTGEHQVWPFQPDWVDHFGLAELAASRSALPAVSTDLRRTTLQQVGRRVAEQFKRYQLPITPYDLRHAWAVRTIHIGLPDTVAARMMGHSVAIHTRTYHHWITRRDQQQAVDAALARLAS